MGTLSLVKLVGKDKCFLPIENDALISAAKASAYNQSETSTDAHGIALKAAELVVATTTIKPSQGLK
jgi:hypothetical protein